jgi:hypothetical protein
MILRFLNPKLPVFTLNKMKGVTITGIITSKLTSAFEVPQNDQPISEGMLKEGIEYVPKLI